MEKLMPLLVGLAVLALILGALKSVPNRQRKYEFKLRETVISPAEQVLYYRLREALPDLVVLAQVGLSRVIEPRQKRVRAPFWHISQKSLDFVICNKAGTAVAAVELDDRSHRAENRARKDRDKDAALQSAGLRVIRWTVKNLPDTAAIRAAVIPPPPSSGASAQQRSGPPLK